MDQVLLYALVSSNPLPFYRLLDVTCRVGNQEAVALVTPLLQLPNLLVDGPYKAMIPTWQHAKAYTSAFASWVKAYRKQLPIAAATATTAAVGIGGCGGCAVCKAQERARGEGYDGSAAAAGVVRGGGGMAGDAGYAGAGSAAPAATGAGGSGGGMARDGGYAGAGTAAAGGGGGDPWSWEGMVQGLKRMIQWTGLDPMGCYCYPATWGTEEWAEGDQGSMWGFSGDEGEGETKGKLLLLLLLLQSRAVVATAEQLVVGIDVAKASAAAAASGAAAGCNSSSSSNSIGLLGSWPEAAAAGARNGGSGGILGGGSRDSGGSASTSSCSSIMGGRAGGSGGSSYPWLESTAGATAAKLLSMAQRAGAAAREFNGHRLPATALVSTSLLETFKCRRSGSDTTSTSSIWVCLKPAVAAAVTTIVLWVLPSVAAVRTLWYSAGLILATAAALPAMKDVYGKMSLNAYNKWLLPYNKGRSGGD